MDERRDYWSGRARKFGHTGWADQTVYAYDRLERLSYVRAAVSALPVLPDRTALDFGCGIGDFSNLLLEMGYTVCGYDPFVKPVLRATRFHYANSYAEIPNRHGTDLVLSITVLDHILGEGNIREALRTISSCLKPGGVLFMVEYALDTEGDRDAFGLKNNYQAFRTLREWELLLNGASLRMADVVPVPHPRMNPSDGYLTYARSPLVRMRRALPNLPLVRTWCDPLLQRRAATIVKSVPPVWRGPSILKLIRCSLEA